MRNGLDSLMSGPSVRKRNIAMAHGNSLEISCPDRRPRQVLGRPPAEARRGRQRGADKTLPAGRLPPPEILRHPDFTGPTKWPIYCQASASPLRRHFNEQAEAHGAPSTTTEGGRDAVIDSLPVRARHSSYRCLCRELRAVVHQLGHPPVAGRLALEPDDHHVLVVAGIELEDVLEDETRRLLLVAARTTSLRPVSRSTVV